LRCDDISGRLRVHGIDELLALPEFETVIAF